MYSEIQNTVHVSGDTVEQIQIQFGWEVGADDGWLRSFKTFKGLDWVLKLTELVCKQTNYQDEDIFGLAFFSWM